MKNGFLTMGEFGVKEQLLAGGLSKVVSVLATYPYQLLRSALQANNSPYKGLADAAQTVRALSASSIFLLSAYIFEHYLNNVELFLFQS